MRFTLLFLAMASFALSSCGLVRSAVQLPVRTLKGVGRTVGMGVIATEVTPAIETEAQTKTKTDIR